MGDSGKESSIESTDPPSCGSHCVAWDVCLQARAFDRGSKQTAAPPGGVGPRVEGNCLCCFVSPRSPRLLPYKEVSVILIAGNLNFTSKLRQHEDRASTP